MRCQGTLDWVVRKGLRGEVTFQQELARQETPARVSPLEKVFTAKRAARAKARPSPLGKANTSSQLSELPPCNPGIADSAILPSLPRDVPERSLSTLGKGLHRFPEYIPSNRGTQPFTGTALCPSCCRAGGLGCTQQLFWDPRGLLGG